MTSLDKPSVHVLVTITDPARVAASTLFFETVRKGFPTWDIFCMVNEAARVPDAIKFDIRERARKANVILSESEWLWHHAKWIEATLLYKVRETREKVPLVIIDPDTVWHSNCEGFKFGDKVLLAGHFNPRMWNDFAKCISHERIHTSFMWMPWPARLLRETHFAYPYADGDSGEYCPCEAFMPAVRFVKGRPYFWDTCSNLYNMLPAEKVAHFTGAHFQHYDHLNSASFYDVMAERLSDPSGFKFVHNELIKTPEKIKNLWRSVSQYYTQKQIEGTVAEWGTLTPL